MIRGKAVVIGLVALLFQGSLDVGCGTVDATEQLVMRSSARIQAVRSGHPDALSVQAGSLLEANLSAAELLYLARLDWSNFVSNPDALLSDPVARHAFRVLAPIANQARLRHGSQTSFGVAMAGLTIGGVASAVARQVVSFAGPAAVASLGVACAIGATTGVGSAVCIGAAVIGIAMLVSDSAHASELPAEGAAQSCASLYPPGSFQDASGGGCEPTPCPMGQTRCSDTCVDLLTDSNNCGSCGSTCATGCSQGSCSNPPRDAGAGGSNYPPGCVCEGVGEFGQLVCNGMDTGMACTP